MLQAVPALLKALRQALDLIILMVEAMVAVEAGLVAPPVLPGGFVGGGGGGGGGDMRVPMTPRGAFDGGGGGGGGGGVPMTPRRRSRSRSPRGRL